jgi:hypothetical protein
MFYYALLLMVLSLTAVVMIDWGHLTGEIRIAYSLLSVLAIYTFYWGWQAKSESEPRIRFRHQII